MISKNAEVPDNFLVLEEKESFGEYARAYGDDLARHYENRGIIYMPRIPIHFDRDFFQLLTFPKILKKVGTAEFIDAPLIVRDGASLQWNERHILGKLFPQKEAALYAQAQIASFNAQLRKGLAQLFPRYYSLDEGNISWRLTETQPEGLHFDVFNNGQPFPKAAQDLHRVKIFVNIDAAPRIWRTGLDMPGVLRACRGELPDALPADINVISHVMDKRRVMLDMPTHKVEYPALSAILVNAELVAHEVLFGRRMVAGEFFCHSRDMLEPALHSYAAVRDWLAENHYTIADNAAEIAHAHDAMNGLLFRSMEALKKA